MTSSKWWYFPARVQEAESGDLGTPAHTVATRLILALGLEKILDALDAPDDLPLYGTLYTKLGDYIEDQPTLVRLESGDVCLTAGAKLIWNFSTGDDYE